MITRKNVIDSLLLVVDFDISLAISLFDWITDLTRISDKNSFADYKQTV
jgi:hypothetical protein